MEDWTHRILAERVKLIRSAVDASGKFNCLVEYEDGTRGWIGPYEIVERKLLELDRGPA